MSNTPIAASTHVRSKELSYRNLQAEREAKKEEGYDSAKDRELMGEVFEERFGSPAREWQLDVAEALCLGLDCVVAAGTGEGKTIPFMLPALRATKHKILVLSPLKVLQEDQVRRFRALGIKSAAVNGDTWNPRLKEQLEKGAIQAIFASPEMCLQHPDFRAYLSDAAMSRDIAMVVVDEAHCISQWGGDFRKDYANIGRLRAFFPTHIPFLATSATLPPAALAEVQSALNIQIDTAFFLNLGNDRPNVTVSVQHVSSPTDYAAHLFHIDIFSRRQSKKRTEDFELARNNLQRCLDRESLRGLFSARWSSHSRR